MALTDKAIQAHKPTDKKYKVFDGDGLPVHENGGTPPDYRDPPLSLQGSADHWNHRDGGHRLLLAAWRVIPPVEPRPATSAVREHGSFHRWGADGDPDAPRQQMPEG